MPQPTLVRTAGRTVATFGGSPLPNGQGTMPPLDLNDYRNTVLTNMLRSDDSNRQIGLDQLLYRARGAYVSDDFGPRVISLPMTYIEDTTHFIGQFLARLSQAGEQQLTFDNLTYILAKYQGATGRTQVRGQQPLAWEFSLDLICKSPWFQDALASTMAPLTLTVDAGQNFSITYNGSVFAEPIWTLVIPSGNTVPINQLQLLNTMSGETLTVNFLSVAAIPASTARTVTIDSSLMTAVDNVGNAYDTYGSFPKLYPPAGQSNAFTVVVVPASGSSAGLTLAASWACRWEI